jgi:hypothetical protein
LLILLLGMIKKWIDRLFGSEPDAIKGKDKSYLLELYDSLAKIKAEDKSVNFSIQEIKKSGFLVKVGGLFAYLPFQNMPWLYRDTRKWTYIAPFLHQTIFRGKIIEMSNDNRILITIDASGTILKTADLEQNKPYKCIVVKKVNYGLMLEMGNNFGWKCGSIEALMHKSTFLFEHEFEQIGEGEIISTQFQGFDKEGRIVMGDKWENKEWQTGELDNLIGTIQLITAKRNENKRFELWYQEKFHCHHIIDKVLYGSKENVKHIRNYLRGLSDDSELMCEIIRLKPDKQTIFIKLSDAQCEEIYRAQEKKIVSQIGAKLSLIKPQIGASEYIDEVDKYIGTVQELDVRIDDEGDREYWFLDKYICIPNDPYKDIKQSREIKKRLKKYINSLEHNSKVWFEIIVRKGRTNKLFVRQNLLSVEKNLSLSPIELLPLDNSVESKSNKIYLTELIPDDLESIIDTEQTIIIKKDEYGSKSYWYDNQYQCIPQRFFENYLDNVKYINQLRKYINSLDTGSQIQCLITDINYKKNKISIALSPIYKTQDIKELVNAREKQRLLRTEQTITIEYDQLEQPIFFLKNQFKCRFPITAIEYRQNKGRIKKYIELSRPREMECLVQGIDAETDEPILRLTLRQQKIIHKELRVE